MKDYVNEKINDKIVIFWFLIKNNLGIKKEYLLRQGESRMKKLILVLFIFMFFINYSCEPAMTNYLGEANVLEDSKELELYKDLRENYTYNLIFKLGNDLYVYGEKFLTVDNNSYEYLGNGYYKNADIIYFFRNEVTKVKGTPEIKTSVKVKTSDKLKGTSCEGTFHDYTHYLEIDGMKFKDDKKERGFLKSLITIIRNLL